MFSAIGVSIHKQKIEWLPDSGLNVPPQILQRLGPTLGRMVNTGIAVVQICIAKPCDRSWRLYLTTINLKSLALPAKPVSTLEVTQPFVGLCRGQKIFDESHS
jgi:hypothetical protein